MSKQLQIRNSTAEFLIFQAEDKTQGVQVFYKDENIWATQEAIATLFDKGRSTIAEHLKNIFESGELDPNSVCRKFRQTAADGKMSFGIDCLNRTLIGLRCRLCLLTRGMRIEKCTGDNGDIGDIAKNDNIAKQKN